MASEAVLLVGLHARIIDSYIRNADLINNTSDKTTIVYMAIFMIAYVFQFVLLLDAVLHKNTVQLIGFVFFNLCATGYQFFEYTVVAAAIRDADTSNDGVSDSTSTSLQLATDEQNTLTGLLYLEFGWSIYKRLGADPAIKIKLDAFFIIGFAVQFLSLVINSADPEFGITIAAIPTLMVVIIIAGKGVFRILTRPSQYQVTKKYILFFVRKRGAVDDAKADTVETEKEKSQFVSLGRGFQMDSLSLARPTAPRTALSGQPDHAMSKNPQLKPGVTKLSRTAAYKAKGKFNIKKRAVVAKVAKPTTREVPVGGPKNGGTRVVPLVRSSKYYPAEHVPKPKLSRKSKVPKPTKIRSSITPGTVLIILAGRFAGKRVVFLKALESGLLLVTGPFKINGVPIRRVNQAYVIATSTKVDISGVTVDEKINDDFFKKVRETKSKDSEEALFETPAKKPVDASRIALQKAVDASVLAAVKKVPSLKAYLNASFYLTKGQAPHLLKF
ncbi:hypothetical protein HK405_005903 [Cladochytrium tenue]|nr:hypothetical protein HK405_005903 [Cladochytrium tenue]